MYTFGRDFHSSLIPQPLVIYTVFLLLLFCTIIFGLDLSTFSIVIRHYSFCHQLYFFLNALFSLSALLTYNSHTMKSTHLKV